MNKSIKDIIAFSLLLLIALKSTIFSINPSRDLFESIKSIEELLVIYKEKSGDNSLSDEELLELARQDWYEIALQETENGQSFDSLPAEVVVVDGVEYRLYGYAHGIGILLFLRMPKEYREFVQEAYRIESDKTFVVDSSELEETRYCSSFIIAEENLNSGISDSDQYIVDMKDHYVINGYKELTKEDRGLFLGFIRGIFIIPGVLEYYSLSLSDAIDAVGILQNFRESRFNRTKDSMNIEIEQGLEKRLPSHLEMELLLSTTEESKLNEVSGQVSTHRTTRSLYMAGFLKGFVEKGKFKEVPLFMGSGHLSEVKGFLIDTNGYAQQTVAYNHGKEQGSLIAANLLEAQKGRNAEELVDAIVRWNPKKPASTLLEAVTFSEVRLPIEQQSREFYLGISLGIMVQVVLAYYFLYMPIKNEYLSWKDRNDILNDLDEYIESKGLSPETRLLFDGPFSNLDSRRSFMRLLGLDPSVFENEDL